MITHDVRIRFKHFPLRLRRHYCTVPTHKKAIDVRLYVLQNRHFIIIRDGKALQKYNPVRFGQPIT